MHFWDASALVALCVLERTSASLRKLAVQEDLITWCLSAVEITSAVERRAREGALSDSGRAEALANLSQLANAWIEVTAIAAVRERANRLLGTHALRAADSVQLAAALVAVEDRPGGHEFVCTDARLCQAAGREGFRVSDYR
jgi:predicted nucleic acid-binding protein